MLSAEERAALRARVGAEICEALDTYGDCRFAHGASLGSDDGGYTALRRASERAEDALLLAIDRLREAHRG